MNDWKLIVKVVIGSALLLFLVIWGLSKMATNPSGIKVDEKVLLDGARFIKENGETKVTVVKFSDMQCPVCKEADQETAALFNMPGVKLVMRLFPLPVTIHRYSVVSARAAEAANELGKGWEMTALLFDKQAEWSVSDKPEDLFVEYAKSLGLDEKTFKDKYASEEVAKNVQTDADLAASLQLPGTPTFFINGEEVAHPFVMDKVKQLLGQ